MATRKDNLNGVAAPTAANDVTQGYLPGSAWWDGSTMWTCQSNATNAAVWLSASGGYDKWYSGEYLYPANFGSGLSDATPASADTIWCFPFEITRQTNSVAIALVTAGSTGAEAVCGLYPSDSANGRPDGQTRIGSSSTTVALDGTTGAKLMTLNRTVTPGLYWLALAMKGVATMPVVKQMNNANARYLRGSSSFLTGGSPPKCRKYNPTYVGQVPATMGGLSNDAGAAPMPAILAA